MKKARKCLWLLLALVMLVTLAQPAGIETVAFAEDSESVIDADTQISLIYSNLSTLLQPDSENIWYYTVVDYDHNGRLEFFAADQHPVNRSTNLMVWEVTADETGLWECTIQKDPEESFPDVISDSADAFYYPDTDTWSYLFYDNVVLSPAEVYTVPSSVSLKNGTVSYVSYAVEHSELVNSYRYVSHTDLSGTPISTEQYNAKAFSAFADAERSAVNFDWFPASAIADASRLSDSYEVFIGDRPAPEKSPIIAPPVLQHDDLTPVQGTAGEPDATYMIITKNPGSEKKRAGESLKFVADANVYDSAYWTFVSPDGGEYDLAYFQAHFVISDISGAYGPVLSIQNIDMYMDGWGAYCTFYFKGQTAVTSTAWIRLRS